MGSLKADVGGQQVATFSDVIDPVQAGPNSGLISPDKTTVRVVAHIKGEGQTVTDKLVPVPGFVAAIRAQNPTLTVYALSNTLANDEISGVITSDLDGSLRLTIPLTFIILLVAFGAVVAAAVPLLLAITSLLAAFGFLGIYSQTVGPVSPYATQLVVLIGLAVAVDYSLFMVTRYRTERHRRGYDSHGFYARSVYLRRLGLTVLAIGGRRGRCRARRAGRAGHRWDRGRRPRLGALAPRQRGDPTEKLRAIVVASGDGRPGRLLQRARRDDLHRRPVPPRRSAVPLDGHRDDRRRPHLGHRLPDVPAGDARHPGGVNAGQVAIRSGARADVARATPRPRSGRGQRHLGALIVGASCAGPGRRVGGASSSCSPWPSPFTRLQLGSGDLTAFPDSIDSVKAINLMNAKWPQGSRCRSMSS